MPDALTTITNLIQSPPGQLAAGGVLAGIVWKFFERVEAVLTDATKFEIAVWLSNGLITSKPSPSTHHGRRLYMATIQTTVKNNVAKP